MSVGRCHGEGPQPPSAREGEVEAVLNIVNWYQMSPVLHLRGKKEEKKKGFVLRKEMCVELLS